MALLQISQCTFRISDTRLLNLNELRLEGGQSWAFVSANGSGKSSLAGELTPEKGVFTSQFARPTRLSLEQLQKLVTDEWQRNNTDLLSEGENDTGRTALEIIQNEVKDAARAGAGGAAGAQRTTRQHGLTGAGCSRPAAAAGGQCAARDAAQRRGL